MFAGVKRKLKEIKEDDLFEAVYRRDTETACRLIEEGVDPDASCLNIKSGSSTILHNSVISNQPEVVKKLLEHGANPDLMDEEGDTPIFAAVYKHIDPEIPRLLIELGANTNHRNKAGNTPLMHLAIHSADFGNEFSENTLFMLLNLYEDFAQRNSRDQTLAHLLPIVHGCDKTDLKNDEHICLRYLKILASKCLSLEERDGNLWTPLHYACLAGCYDAVLFLLQQGVDVNARSVTKQSTLHTLGMKSNKESFENILDLLLDRGCQINETDINGYNILHYMTSSNTVNKQAVSLVLSRGVSASATDVFGFSPLHLCTMHSVFISRDQVEDDEDLKNNVSEVVKVLVDNGAEINCTDINGLTPLHCALRYSRKVETVQTLLGKGASVTARTKTGETALHRATLYENLLKVMLEHTDTHLKGKIDFNMQDNWGSTALHWAVYYISPGCVKMLVKRGADASIADAEGRTARQYAVQLRNTQVFETLGITNCQETYPLPCKITPLRGKTNEQTEDICEDSTGSMDFEGKLYSKPSTYFTHSEKDVNGSNFSVDSSNEMGESPKEDEVELEEEEMCLVDHVWGDCPELKEVVYEDKEIKFDAWKEHLLLHQVSLSAYIRTILQAQQMGLFHNLSENDDIARGIQNVMNFVAHDIKTRCPLFEFSLSLAGSWNEGTKTRLPEEFDYKLILKHFSSAFAPKEKHAVFDPVGYVRFVKKDEFDGSEFDHFLSEHGFLDSRKVIRVLYFEINISLTKLSESISKNLYLVKYLEPEKASIDHISLRWVGGTYKNMLIDVDIVPTITTDSWKPSCINSERTYLKSFTKESYSVVMKTPDSRFASDWNCLFRISVADVEAELFKSLPEPVVKAYILVKALTNSPYYPLIYMADEDILRKTSLTTYHLKTCFFHEVECMRKTDLQNAARWTSKKTVKLASKMLDKLHAITHGEGFLESYFIEGVNVLANDSLFRFNDSVFFQCEITCLQRLLKVGTSGSACGNTKSVRKNLLSDNKPFCGCSNEKCVAQ